MAYSYIGFVDKNDSHLGASSVPNALQSEPIASYRVVSRRYGHARAAFDLVDVLNKSGNPFLKALFPEPDRRRGSHASAVSVLVSALRGGTGAGYCSR